jgi:flagella basal body P-ring formation protein FlgA
MELPSVYKFFFALRPLNTRLWSKATLGIFAAYSLLTATSLVQAQTYSPIELKRDVAKFLTTEYSNKGNIKVSVGNLGKRLRLHRCLQEPDMSLRDSVGTGGNISVHVQCKTAPGWSVHIPAQVSIFRELPVAIRDIARGEQISPADIHWKTINISGLRQAFHTDAQAIIGQEVKRNIGQGLPFITSLLDAPTLIRRGDVIDLEAQAGSIKVSTSGTALTDGRLGQKIRIKNNQSDRIVTGTVVASGKVSTL